MVANAGICTIGPFAQSMCSKAFCALEIKSYELLNYLATAEDWDNLFRVNARGVFLCYKYGAEQMVKQGRGGRIIGAASVAGKKGEAYKVPDSRGFVLTTKH